MASENKQTYNAVDPNDAIKSWDLNGDGQITALEMAVAHDKQMEMESKSHNMKKVVCVCITLCLVVIGTMLATTILANELSKDSRPDSNGVMEDRKANTVSTQEYAMTDVPLDVALLSVEPADLRLIDRVEFVDPVNGGYYSMAINAAVRFNSQLVELYPSTDQFTKIVVTPGFVKAWRADGKFLLVSGSPALPEARRRLLASKNGSLDGCRGSVQLKGKGSGKLAAAARDFVSATWSCVCKANQKKFCHWNQVALDAVGVASPSSTDASGQYWNQACHHATAPEPCDEAAQAACALAGFQSCSPGSADCGPEIEPPTPPPTPTPTPTPDVDPYSSSSSGFY